MKKILDWLTKWDKDKVLHFSICFIISMVSAYIAKVFGADKYTVLATAWCVGFIAGMGKELYDEWKYKGADEHDWAADLAGIVFGTILSFLFVA